MNAISKILATTEPIRQATGFVFTEGPVWHPNDVWYFNDIRPGAMYRMVLGEAPELIRKTEGGNGMTFDLEGRLVQCEGEGNRISRAEHDGTVSVLVDRFEGRRLQPAERYHLSFGRQSLLYGSVDADSFRPP